jgi:hypothetical protein
VNLLGQSVSGYEITSFGDDVSLNRLTPGRRSQLRWLTNGQFDPANNTTGNDPIHFQSNEFWMPNSFVDSTARITFWPHTMVQFYGLANLRDVRRFVYEVTSRARTAITAFLNQLAVGQSFPPPPPPGTFTTPDHASLTPAPATQVAAPAGAEATAHAQPSLQANAHDAPAQPSV